MRCPLAKVITKMLLEFGASSGWKGVKQGLLCSNVNNGAVIPDSDVVLAPAVTDLKIVVLDEQLLD
jgi:hypothetical protein